MSDSPLGVLWINKWLKQNQSALGSSSVERNPHSES